MAPRRLIAHAVAGLLAFAALAATGRAVPLAAAPVAGALFAAGRPSTVRAGLLVVMAALVIAATPPVFSGPLLLVAAEVGFAVGDGREPSGRHSALVFCGALAASAACLGLGGLSLRYGLLVVAGAVGTGALVANLGRIARG